MPKLDPMQSGSRLGSRGLTKSVSLCFYVTGRDRGTRLSQTWAKLETVLRVAATAEGRRKTQNESTKVFVALMHFSAFPHKERSLARACTHAFQTQQQIFVDARLKTDGACM